VLYFSRKVFFSRAGAEALRKFHNSNLCNLLFNLCNLCSFSLFSQQMEIKKGGIVENILITDAGTDGKSIAKIEGYVVIVDGAVPGDEVDIEIFKKKKNYAEGRAVRIIKDSPFRSLPFCQHFGTCGGCKWQNMTYEKQLFFKQKHVEDALERIGKLTLPAITPILGSAETKYYRNKLEYTFSNTSWLSVEELKSGTDIHIPALGYHIPKRFDKILDIKTCYLQDDLSNQLRLAIKDFCIKNNYSFFDPIRQTGLLRNVIIRSSTTGEWMIVMVFSKNDKEKIQSLLDYLRQEFPQLTSIQYVINPKKNDTINDLEVSLFHGRDYIIEKMEELSFRISAKSFFQTNSLQAYRLYCIVREFASLKGSENVYDLYTGTGTIALFLARHTGKVTGIDYTADAIADARQNAADNSITNISFTAGDIKDTLTGDFVKIHGKPDVIITDPPRAGMHEDVVKMLIELDAEKIIYVSCNPSTQARDIQMLNDHYRIEKIQPVDMFPHTTHVENVVLLVKLKS
jgi:23S rRNA (uracil1939-C5)-methyltransferase